MSFTHSFYSCKSHPWKSLRSMVPVFGSHSPKSVTSDQRCHSILIKPNICLIIISTTVLFRKKFLVYIGWIYILATCLIIMQWFFLLEIDTKYRISKARGISHNYAKYSQISQGEETGGDGGRKGQFEWWVSDITSGTW